MRIDSHHHLWQPDRGDYPWMEGAPEILKRPYGPLELKHAIAGTGIQRTVLVQAAPTEAETHFMLEQAALAPEVAAVIGWVDMLDSAVSGRLDLLFENPLFRGIRPMLQDIEDTEWILNPQFEPVLQALVEKNGVFDALGKGRHLGVLDVFAGRYPNLSIVLDHMIKPDIAGGGLKEWAPGFRKLARHSNVTCKLSGLLSEAGPGATVADLRPYFEVALDAFGPDRLMFGSDWPVLVATERSYLDWVRMADRLIADLSKAEQAKIQGETAMLVYRIDQVEQVIP